jgi:hypothetical protein
MSEQKMSSGRWVVGVLIAMGIIGAAAGVMFRQMPGRALPPTTARTGG